ncbi:hypothetical protein ACFSJU_12105 [Paradesertivirga mongoliensis]|uniref:Uncharacterized protein n=1 Tax=Paradesertivirga mongoliensis TaxID=2100740 RepID=A0ABW4ZMM8_9SPHI|nr:hypothetical protein [Pedobacter mongoliensis]
MKTKPFTLPRHLDQRERSPRYEKEAGVLRDGELGYLISSAYRGDISPHNLDSTPVRYDGIYVASVCIGHKTHNK